MRWKTALLCAGLVLVIAASAPGAGESTGGVDITYTADTYSLQVSGAITDEATGKPVPGAAVRASLILRGYHGPDLFEQCPFADTTADAQGRYALQLSASPDLLEDLAEVSLCVSAVAPGYGTRPKYAEAGESGIVTVDIALKTGKRVWGKVTDERGAPVEGALVRVQNGMNGDWNHFGHLGRAISDKDGAFEIGLGTEQSDDLGNDPWLLVSKPGQGSVVAWDILKQQDLGTVVLASDTEVTGRVVDEQGRGVPEGEVSARMFPVGLVDVVTTDSDGRFVLRGIRGKIAQSNFFLRKNGQVDAHLPKADVYARSSTSLRLTDALHAQVAAREGETVILPDFVATAMSFVTGTLHNAQAVPPLNGLLVYLDSREGKMVKADADGTFVFANVPPGKHTLTAFLPYNRRGDRGIGRTEIVTVAGENLENVTLELEPLAEVRVRYLDALGNPLKGIKAGATWNPGGGGFWTEGTRSDDQGYAVLYLYPGEKQYVGGFSPGENGLVAEIFEEIVPEAGEAGEVMQVVMVQPAVLEGRVIDTNNRPVSEQEFGVRLSYADGSEARLRAKTDGDGRFRLDESMRPGLLSAVFTTEERDQEAQTPSAVEAKPGETADLGDLTLRPVPMSRVSGQLVASSTLKDLKGLKIRLDLDAWEPMVETDAEGRFTLRARPGKHRLIAYLPHNLRTDRGVGHVEVEVGDKPIDGVQLPLEDLAVVPMRITDESGKPLEGMSAAAWWTENHSGVFTEGTKSDTNGAATLYLYPDCVQYVGALDWNRAWSMKEHHVLTLKAGETGPELRVVMAVPEEDR